MKTVSPRSNSGLFPAAQGPSLPGRRRGGGLGERAVPVPGGTQLSEEPWRAAHTLAGSRVQVSGASPHPGWSQGTGMGPLSYISQKSSPWRGSHVKIVPAALVSEPTPGPAPAPPQHQGHTQRGPKSAVTSFSLKPRPGRRGGRPLQCPVLSSALVTLARGFFPRGRALTYSLHVAHASLSPSRPEVSKLKLASGNSK